MKCDRSFRRHQKIAADLAAYRELMNELIELGMTRTNASKAAFDVVTRKITREAALEIAAQQP